MMQLCVQQLAIHVFLNPYLMRVISICLAVTVVTVLVSPSVDGCVVSVATLPQRLQSSFQSFKIDGLCLAWSWLIVLHIAAEEVVNTRTLWRKAFHSCLERSLFGNLLLFFFFGRVWGDAFKMSKEDLQCDINAKHFRTPLALLCPDIGGSIHLKICLKIIELQTDHLKKSEPFLCLREKDSAAFLFPNKG